ncbi:iron-sulfur protein [Virgisporangium aliadipatigenens]|uniref:Cytochrome bc1 complex Rieske iron-sulfur subunit n=1 Tax=Virgisporangium aliadipatigenens TaxID=741659 RepID=A0A8J3YN58_9ACTN|nr:Rieske (2Fe-2S) protein [Virgisporangium aliadipatigenens]GIJ47407.1 iron-sulfur protein [Virgisporangium aliadipatigenens]
MSDTTRRSVLAGAAGITAATALAACGDDLDAPGTDNAAPPAAGTSGPAGGSSPSGKASSTAGNGAAAGIAAVADIPVGGGKIFAEQKVVVTQPTAGTIKAFSVTCTHQGCPVSKIEAGNIVCTCHNSKFKVADGSPAGGPATKPLTPATVKVENGRVVLG